MLPIERSQSEYSVLQVVNAEHEKLPALQVVPEQGGDAPQVVPEEGGDAPQVVPELGDDAPQVLFDDEKFPDLEVTPVEGSYPEVVIRTTIANCKFWNQISLVISSSFPYAIVLT